MELNIVISIVINYHDISQFDIITQPYKTPKKPSKQCIHKESVTFFSKAPVHCTPCVTSYSYYNSSGDHINLQMQSIEHFFLGDETS